MFVVSSVAQFLSVNCYAVALDGASECVLFDAGLDGSGDLAATLDDEGLSPVALILTHGHPDHVLGVPHFYERFGQVPTYLHQSDVYRLEDPLATMSPDFQPLLAPLLAGWTMPEVVPTTGGQTLHLAGLTVTLTHLPGHTEGSCVFEVSEQHEPGTGVPESLMFTGDVLFAGSVGRVDLPGGDPAAMAHSLKHLKEMRDQPVYPGHGPATRLSHEIRVNPFL